ncbi:MAG: hypothetical protein QXS10_06775 [Candidatus Bathyarchaeia archaeon]|nr:hypothetical protein [Candidatus Bathyarchaeota archaeon]
MEKFLPILDVIRSRLAEILSKNRDGMCSWDLEKLRNVGDDLIKLSSDVYPRLLEVGHRILYQSIREAGLGIIWRVSLIEKNGEVKAEDKEYFANVYEALQNIHMKIESGEYYRALLEIANKRRRDEKEQFIL